MWPHSAPVSVDRDPNEATALHYAAEKGRYEVVRCLLRHGGLQTTPRHLVALFGQRAVVFGAPPSLWRKAGAQLEGRHLLQNPPSNSILFDISFKIIHLTQYSSTSPSKSSI
eukprot:Selendium_serpulae@DN5467_c0_g1_i7.p1